MCAGSKENKRCVGDQTCYDVLLHPVEVHVEALGGEVVVVWQAQVENERAVVVLEPVLKNSQVNVLNLQGEVVVIVYVNGAVLIVQVVIVLDPTYGPSQGCEPMGGQACSLTNYTTWFLRNLVQPLISFEACKSA